MAFLRNLLASILGTLFALGILFFMFIIFASLASATDEVRVKNDSVLKLEFPFPVSEHSGSDPDDPFTLFFEPKMGLDQIVQAIQVAKEDDRIRGISISTPFIVAGMAQTKTIRDALEEFKESGKFIYAYADFYMQKDYYLSSIADSIFISPSGNLDFKGLAAEVLYFKDFQEKSGLKMEVVRHGKYKSAVEPFLANEMSSENREQLSVLLHSLWESMRDGIGESRNIPSATLDLIADSLKARTPKKALAEGLVDAIVYGDQYEDKILRESGASGKHPEFIGLQRYMRYSRKRPVYKGSDEIAVVYAQGEILYGEGSPDFIGQGKMTTALRKAREDKDVKAVVMRINSPGGSALTSELIWRELQLTRKEKPVVISLSDMAASGGYYMAVGGDKILAEPNTITGSIGVFATIPNLNGISEKVGINAEQVGTHHFSMDYSFFEPMREDFKEVLREGIDETYQVFLKRVAEGRSMSMARADSLAQGRIWSGKQALENGLVDGLGGMPQALEMAAEMAGITEFKLQVLPRYKTGIEKLMEDLSGGQVLADRWITSELGPQWAETIQSLKHLFREEGIQARMPFILKIQ